MSLARIAQKKNQEAAEISKDAFLINCKNLCRFWHRDFIIGLTYLTYLPYLTINENLDLVSW